MSLEIVRQHIIDPSSDSYEQVRNLTQLSNLLHIFAISDETLHDLCTLSAIINQSIVQLEKQLSVQDLRES